MSHLAEGSWPSLWAGDWGGCIAILDDDVIFATGLSSDRRQTKIYTRSSNTWTSRSPMGQGTSLDEARLQMNCGVIRDDYATLRVLTESRVRTGGTDCLSDFQV